jgi:four helix bundle protein
MGNVRLLFPLRETQRVIKQIRLEIREMRYEIRKAKNRNLIYEEEYSKFIEDINLIGEMLNSYIKSIGEKTN